MPVDSSAGTSDVGEPASSELQVIFEEPSSLWGQSISSEDLPEEYIIEGVPGEAEEELHMVGRVPWYSQGPYQCGQYSVASVLQWFGVMKTASDVMEYLNDYDETCLEQLENALGHFLGPDSYHSRGGFDNALLAAGLVRYAIALDIPVIVGIKAPGTGGIGMNHWVTIVGYDATGWYIHDTYGYWPQKYDVHVTYSDFDELWDCLYSDSGTWNPFDLGYRACVLANRYWGDGIYPHPVVYTIGGVPDVYDNMEDCGTPYPVEVALSNFGAEEGRYAHLEVEVVGAKIVGVALTSWDDWHTWDSSNASWGKNLPASVIEFDTGHSTPIGYEFKATLYLYPTASSQPAQDGYIHTGYIRLSGSIWDEDDLIRHGWPDWTWIDDDSMRDWGPTGLPGVFTTEIRRLELYAYPQEVSYKILDDDVAPPTIHGAGALYDTIYDCDAGPIEFYVEASDASDIYSAEFRYGFSDIFGSSSDWLPPAYSWSDDSNPRHWYYTFAVPHEEWVNHVGTDIWWNVKLVDADYDMNRPDDRSEVIVVILPAPTPPGSPPNPYCPLVHIEDDDLCGPTFSLPTPLCDYVSDSRSFKVWAEASDPSGISLVQIRYRFSDSDWSDWLEATGDEGLYSVCFSPEIWESHAGELIYWQAYAEDGDSDRPGDCSSSLSVEFSTLLLVLDLVVVAESPVNIMVTAPSGLRVGYDSVLGSINEIAGATYSGPATEPQTIVIPNTIAGTYRVDAFGTGSGSFTITIEPYFLNGSLVGRHIWTGVAEPGGQYSRSIVFQSDRIESRSFAVCGTVFLDRYNPGALGTRESDESGLGNWMVSLEGWTPWGTWVSRTQNTDNLINIGHYDFFDVPEGVYSVNITCLIGYYYTTPICQNITIAGDETQSESFLVDFGVLVPSPDPECRFVLENGWNLWSTPVSVEGLTAKSLLAAIGPTGVMVSKLDTAAQKWVSYVVGDPDEFDFPIELGKGYYVWSDSYTVFKLKGDLVLDSTTPLAAGWNIIGYNSLESIMASEALNLVSGTTAWMITYLDADSGKYVSYVRGDPAEFDFVVTPGRAYFIWVDGPGTLAYG